MVRDLPNSSQGSKPEDAHLLQHPSSEQAISLSPAVGLLPQTPPNFPEQKSVVINRIVFSQNSYIVVPTPNQTVFKGRAYMDVIKGKEVLRVETLSDRISVLISKGRYTRDLSFSARAQKKSTVRT